MLPGLRLPIYAYDNEHTLKGLRLLFGIQGSTLSILESLVTRMSRILLVCGEHWQTVSLVLQSPPAFLGVRSSSPVLCRIRSICPPGPGLCAPPLCLLP